MLSRVALGFVRGAVQDWLLLFAARVLLGYCVGYGGMLGAVWGWVMQPKP